MMMMMITASQKPQDTITEKEKTSKAIIAEKIYGQDTNSFGENMVVNEQTILHIKYEVLQGGKQEVQQRQIETKCLLHTILKINFGGQMSVNVLWIKK